MHHCINAMHTPKVYTVHLVDKVDSRLAVHGGHFRLTALSRQWQCPHENDDGKQDKQQGCEFKPGYDSL